MSTLATRRALFAVLIASLVLAACASPTPEPTPTPAPDEWDRIRAAGKIVVGTAADYPPFTFYNQSLQFDGFDIALMTAIAQKMGVQVGFVNFAFEGLIGAVQLGQIDAAIGALSVTPERQARVDFSDVYYVGEDGVLAPQDSPITSVASAADMAGRRVGVLRGSVYEEWLTSQLPPDAVQVYVKTDDAIRDLRDRRIDLVMLDLLPAQSFAQQGGVRLVGRGLNMQRLAIAVRKGAASLQREINQALTQLNNEGRLAQLAQQYLGVGPGQMLPTPTAGPAPAETPAAPAPACIPGMALVQDLTYEDNDLTAIPTVQPGQPFTKGWRVSNTGTCAWTAQHQLVFVQGNVPAARMGGESVSVAGQVPPGGTADLKVNLVAPANPGTYVGYWQMQDETGAPFGQRIHVAVSVPAFPTATPRPTQTPVPNSPFSANPTTVDAGQPVVFQWKVANAKNVYFYEQGEPWQYNAVQRTGSRVVYPQFTTVYELRVVRRDNYVEVRQIRIDVNPSGNGPLIRQFSIAPDYMAALGQCVTIQWNVEGNVSRIRIAVNGGALLDGAPAVGSAQHCPHSAGSYTYSLDASGPGGTNRAQRRLEVVRGNTPVPTPPPAGPVIDAMSALPAQVPVGACVTIAWRVRGATFIQVLRGASIIIDGAQPSGNTLDCPLTPGVITYRIRASDQNGRSTTRDQQVSVGGGGSSNPLAGSAWRVMQYWDGDSLEPPLASTFLTVRFGFDNTVDGFAGCNTFSARYIANASTLSVASVNASTQVCSQPGVMTQERAFLRALQEASRYNTSGSTLTAQNGAGRTMLMLARSAP